MVSIIPAHGMILVSALGYAGATVVMARFGSGLAPVPVLLVGAALVLAVGSEIVALRQLPIGIVYLAILGLETVLVLVAAACLGEALGLRELVGGALVLTGAVLLAAGQG